MPIIRAVVNFQSETELPEDVVQNVFHFAVPVGPIEAGDIADIGAALNRFYCLDSGAGAGEVKVMDFMAAAGTSPGLPFVNYYNVGVGGVTGSPIGFSELLGAGYNVTDAPLPKEVAVCLSFHGDLTDVPESVPVDPAGPENDLRLASRRRGRIFLGNLALNAQVAETDGARVNPNLQRTLVLSAERLMNDADFATRGITWVVYSRKADVSHDVVGGWVDDAFDVQRRRGLAPSARQIFPV